MAIRSANQVSSAQRTVHQHVGAHHTTTDGRVFKFWSLAPEGRIWLTDGKEFLAVDAKKYQPVPLIQRTIEDLDKDAEDSWKGHSLPVCDDRALTAVGRMAYYKKWRASDGWHNH